MKTGTKHQNKNNRGEGGRGTEEKEKSSKYKENQRRENMLEGRKKKACIFMPQPIEQQYKSRLALESRLLKYKSLKKYNLFKVKMPPKIIIRMLQKHSFYKCKALSNPI